MTTRGSLNHNHRHKICQIRPLSLFLVATIVLMFPSGCGRKPVNSLDDAVYRTWDPGGSVHHPGNIVEQRVQGDWAYVRTESVGIVGRGEFVVVDTPGGRRWTVLSFAVFEVRGEALSLLQVVVGGDLAQAKEPGLDKKLRQEAEKRWDDYLAAQGYSIEKGFATH